MSYHLTPPEIYAQLDAEFHFDMRYGGIVRWLDENGKLCPGKAPQVISILRA